LNRSCKNETPTRAGLRQRRRITQVVDGSWGIHGIIKNIKKSLFAGAVA